MIHYSVFAKPCPNQNELCECMSYSQKSSKVLDTVVYDLTFKSQKITLVLHAKTLFFYFLLMSCHSVRISSKAGRLTCCGTPPHSDVVIEGNVEKHTGHNSSSLVSFGGSHWERKALKKFVWSQKTLSRELWGFSPVKYHCDYREWEFWV